MTQSNLGTAVGLTYQQIQKYERGADRVFSSRLFEFSKVLDVPVDYFFDQLTSASGRDHEDESEPARRAESASGHASGPRSRAFANPGRFVVPCRDDATRVL